MRYFRVEEAEQLIPELEKIFKSLQEISRKAQVKAEAIRKLEENETRNMSQLAIERSQIQFLANEISEWFQKIADLGALPKGMSPPLVDFPGRVDGKEVYLCWQLGEKSITSYHGIEEGFSGRKPLPKILH